MEVSTAVTAGRWTKTATSLSWNFSSMGARCGILRDPSDSAASIAGRVANAELHHLYPGVGVDYSTYYDTAFELDASGETGVGKCAGKGLCLVFLGNYCLHVHCLYTTLIIFD